MIVGNKLRERERNNIDRERDVPVELEAVVKQNNWKHCETTQSNWNWNIDEISCVENSNQKYAIYRE